MKTRIWCPWRDAMDFALALLGIGLAGGSVGGEDYDDRPGVG
jgi:hypothetical protein